MLYLLCIAPDGYATRDGFTYRRWAVAASTDGRAPAFRYRNGGPRGLARPTAAKEPPAWQHRAVGFVRAVGGLPLAELEAVVAWYHAHRVGAYPFAGATDAWAAK